MGMKTFDCPRCVGEMRMLEEVGPGVTGVLLHEIPMCPAFLAEATNDRSPYRRECLELAGAGEARR